MKLSIAPGASSPMFLALGCVGFIASAMPATAHSAEVSTQDAVDSDQADEPRLGGVTVVDTAIEDEGVKVERLESPKYTRPLLDTPQTVTVIGNQTIRQQNLLTLREALTTVPGITFGAGEGGGGYGDSINLRGQTANNDIQIDGVRDSAQYTRSDTFNLQQIEVVNGANSVYGGSGSIGGTINLVTKRPQADDLTVVQAGIGTDDYYRATADSNLRVTDMIAVRLNAMAHKNDIPARDFDYFERWGVAPSLTLGIDGPTRLSLLYVHQEDENTPVYGVPYYKNAFYDGLLPGSDYRGYYGYKDFDRQDQKVDQATIIFEHDFNDTVSLRNLSRWQRVEQNIFVNPPQGTFCLDNGQTPTGTVCPAGQNVPGTFYPSGPRGTTRLSENQLMFNQTDLRAVLGTGGLEHSINIGIAISQEDYQLSSGNSLRSPLGATPNPALPPIDLSDPDPVYGGPVNYIPTAYQEGDTRNIAVYLFDAIKLSEQFEINGGIRYESNRADFRADTIAGAPVTFGAYTRGAVQRADDDFFTYRVGLVFKPVPNASLYAAYGNSRNPTSVSVRAGCGQITNGVDFCDVAPEEAVNYEVGGKIDLFDGGLQLTAAAFRNERTNYRVAVNDPSLPSPTVPVNDGRLRVDGISLGASGNITPQWTIFANYTYLDTLIRQSISNFSRDAGVFDPQAGNPMINTPKHSGSLFTAYTLPIGLQIGYGLTYTGSFLLNNSRTTPTTVFYKSDDWLTHRLFLSYPVNDRLTAQLNVQNVTDEKYYTGIRNNGWAVPGEGRSAVLSLFYNF